MFLKQHKSSLNKINAKEWGNKHDTILPHISLFDTSLKNIGNNQTNRK